MAGYIGKAQSLANLSEADTLDSVAERGATTDVAVALTDGLTVDKDGATVATFDRATSDGTVIDLQKDGTTVGSIGVDTFDNLEVEATRELKLTQNRNQGRTLVWTDVGGTDSVLYSVNDNNTDLGQSGQRFKNLYLSGGVYLGGTTSTNYLDDYEEGTFTPTFNGSSTNPSVSYTFQYGTYTKIGNLVYLAINVNGSISGGSGVLEIRGWPFTAANNSTYPHLSGGMIFGDSGSSTVQYTLRFVPNQAYCNVQEYVDNGGDFAMDLSACQGTFIVQFTGVIQV